VEGWLVLPQAWIPVPGGRHLEIFNSLIAGESRGSLVHDAHLAALAIEHGLTVCSTDRDFARFTGVRWENPLSDD
jgi:predicted nucleic acid-binding protein